jgi:hypothetical protein
LIDIIRDWICPRCQNELGEYNGWCEYCKHSDNIIVYNPDAYFIRDVYVRHIKEAKPLTPQEELFSQLFNHEKILVKDMDMLTLRAHREELAKIAFEARARLTAADDEESNRKKKSQPKGPSGFERSVNTDETTTNAINAIKERQKKLTKAEKIQAGLEKLGISTADAEKLMSAGTILGRLNKVKSSETEKIVEAVSKQDSVEVSEPKKIFNPFEKKN